MYILPHFSTIDLVYKIMLTLWQADVTAGNIQNLPISRLMLQCVTPIQKFSKNRVILRL